MLGNLHSVVEKEFFGGHQAPEEVLENDPRIGLAVMQFLGQLFNFPVGWVSGEGSQGCGSDQADGVLFVGFQPAFDDAFLAVEFAVEGIAVAQVQDLNDAGFVASLAFAGDSPLISAESPQKVAVNTAVEQLQGSGSFGIELGIAFIPP
jgi:hypothetical protein